VPNDEMATDGGGGVVSSWSNTDRQLTRLDTLAMKTAEQL